MKRAVREGPGLDANLDPHYVGLLVKELQPQGPIELAEQLGERERSMLQLVALCQMSIRLTSGVNLVDR